MEKWLKPGAILLAIFIPLASYIGTSAVLFHRVGQLEQQDTTKLDARISSQWAVIAEIRRNQDRFLGEWEYVKDQVESNERMIDTFRPIRGQ